jgi:rod shape-determining protein MreC
MRNLIAFLRRFRIFLVFLTLQIFALYTYFTYLNFPRAQYLTSASVVTGYFLDIKHDITKHWNLGLNNTNLQKENIKLRKKMPNSFMSMNNGKYKINDTIFDQQYDYIPAIVINSTFDKRNNFFTLNVGSDQGIKRDMGVFTDKGIIGIVHNTSRHYSVVKSVLTKAINIDVMIDNSGAFGLLKWNGRDSRYGTISGISNDMKIAKNTKVLTRGGGGIFPRGLTVGYIQKLEDIEGKPLWNVTMRFSEDYRSIQRVYVINNLLKKEQELIEQTIPQEAEQ